MRRRQQFPPVPAPSNQELDAAKAVAAAINQGLPGSRFCMLLDVMNSDSVKKAAQGTLAELIAWFQQDTAAAAILNQCPTFEQFAADFHAAARKKYPQ